ncbi:hypothetical protein F5884DRAFT_763249 [Xylogone sp. PMI_703]|nr:hypothetical protein F5884DRAFT_763249 [Xylogone sp. PMI_703]
MSSKPDSAINLKLKHITPTPLDATCRSDEVHSSPVPYNDDIRQFYLENHMLVPPPLISCSEFVPSELVALLMRYKKDSALGVKFEERKSSTADDWDKITDMEGAMHTFVTPIVPRCEMVGDYRFARGHGVSTFGGVEINDENGDTKKVRLTRSVVMSANIQMDFEGPRVMLRACKLGSQEVTGHDLTSDNKWSILGTKEKHKNRKREDYDESLRQHMVFHLTSKRKLPEKSEITDPLDFNNTISYLESLVLGPGDTDQMMGHKFARLRNNKIISLEFLFNTALHQVRNEISALEAMCCQGYVYTYDPASIFAREIGAQILNRLMIAALKHLSNHNQFKNMKIFGFNDYTDPGIVSLVKVALEKQTHVKVVRKADLFGGPEDTYDLTGFPEARGSMLVVHNNSDGFGQNIETEGAFGSLDGAIGSSSSAAGSLKRDRADLLDYTC